MLLSKHGRCILLALVLGGTEVKARGYLGGSGNGLPDTSSDTDTTSVDIESSGKGKDSGSKFLRKLAGFSPLEEGRCVKADGSRLTGYVELNSIDGNTEGAQQKCLHACLVYHATWGRLEKFTGCELAWNQDIKGCFAITESIVGGNGMENRYCWLVSDDDYNDVPDSMSTPGDMTWPELLADMDTISDPTSDVNNWLIDNGYVKNINGNGNGSPTDAPTNAPIPPIDCGGHDAPNCEACPYDANGNHMGSAWCNGNCHWCNGECQSSVCPPPISCGGHYAPNCEACPYNEIGTYMGPAWCNGQCHWSNDECQSSNDGE